MPPCGGIFPYSIFGLNVAQTVSPDVEAKLGPTAIRFAVQQLSPS